MLLGGIIYATDRMYPGNSLYPYKLKFEGIVLAASKILNKQVDFSIDLVMKRSDEATKTLASNSVSPDYVQQTLDRLDSQMTQTADSISQISDPVQKKQAAVKYIAKLNQVSSSLNEEKQKQTQSSTNQEPSNGSTNNSPTNNPSPSAQPAATTVTAQIDNTQQTIQQTIGQMTTITNSVDAAPAAAPTDIPTVVVAPTDIPMATPTPDNQLGNPGLHGQNSQNSITSVIPTDQLSASPTTTSESPSNRNNGD